MAEEENLSLAEIIDIKEVIPSVLNNQVSISNMAARAAQGFGLREKRLVMIGVSKINSKKPLSSFNTVQSRTVRVTAQEYAEVGNVSIDCSYGELKDACENLFNRYLRYKVTTPRGIKERKLRWIEDQTYHHGLGYVEFTFAQTVMPHLADLFKLFTKYKLSQVEGLRNLFTWRLLELLTSMTNDEYVEEKIDIPLDTLRYELEIPDSYKYANIRERVLEPAINELIKKDGWEISWTPKKKGRAVASIHFTYRKTAQSDLFRD
ncbi:MAG: hypothetical protein DSY77_07180 [Bacteroidetes bacterium]|jgi:plasmid replication initiation protein|nr:MAG: hypothetical protein DSY77_07180 [Bacteroidota bacterium]